MHIICSAAIANSVGFAYVQKTVRRRRAPRLSASDYYIFYIILYFNTMFIQLGWGAKNIRVHVYYIMYINIYI